MSNQLRLQVLGTLAFVHLTEVLDERAYPADETLVKRKWDVIYPNIPTSAEFD